MKNLSTDWFMEGLQDFEYKKYLLLAYLQHVSKEFAEVRLYPSFSDLIHHYQNLALFKNQKQQLSEKFPKSLSKVDFKKMKLTYQAEITDGNQLEEIESIIEYAIPNIKKHLKDGKDIYEHIEEHINIEPVGVTPLYFKEGYILLRVEPRKTIKAYEYKIIFFENTDANYHGISLTYLDTFRLSIVNTYESIKKKLIHSSNMLPNPATWLLYVVNPFPEEASLLPVAKRKMLTYLKN